MEEGKMSRMRFGVNLSSSLFFVPRQGNACNSKDLEWQRTLNDASACHRQYCTVQIIRYTQIRKRAQNISQTVSTPQMAPYSLHSVLLLVQSPRGIGKGTIWDGTSIQHTIIAPKCSDYLSEESLFDHIGLCDCVITNMKTIGLCKKKHTHSSLRKYWSPLAFYLFCCLTTWS